MLWIIGMICLVVAGGTIAGDRIRLELWLATSAHRIVGVAATVQAWMR